MTNPTERSTKTGEFWFASAIGLGILTVAHGLNIAVDEAVVDGLQTLLAQAFVGIAAIVALVKLGITVFNRRTDLKTAMIEQGIIVQGGKETVDYQIPTVDTTLPQPNPEEVQPVA